MRRSAIARFLKDTSGVTAIEYALIAAFVGLGIIVSLTVVGDSLSAIFDRIATELQN